LTAFHVGGQIVRPDELWGVRVTMDFHLLPPATITRTLQAARFAVEEIREREPCPDVDPSRRA
jgi:hypothetical protein